MAESVERRLEQFVPAFEQLQQLGVFKPEEIKSIIVRTREFENNLTSRNVRPEKFLDYLQYEASLLQLTEVRKTSIGIDPFKQRLLSDVDFPKHIHSIYRRMVGTFPDDLKLWNLYFDFCESRADLKSLHVAFDQCLQRHRNKPDVWIRAARFEMINNNNPELARTYMFTAIEINKKSAECYATLAETICYISSQIKERSEIQDIQVEADLTKAPLKVYETALNECEGNLGTVYSLFFDVFTTYKIPVEPLIEATEAKESPELYAAIALKNESDDAVYEAFRRYISEHPSTDLMIKFADFLGERKNGDELVEILDKIDGFSDDEATRFCELLLKCGKYEDANDMLYDGESNDRMRKCKLQIIAYKSEKNDEFLKNAREYIKQQPNKKELNSLMAFLYAKRNPDFEDWLSVLLSVATHVETDELAKMMKFTLLHYSAKQADTLLTKLTAIVVPTPLFIEVATEIAAQNEGSEDRIRHMHEIAVQKWGKVEASVWLNYCTFEFNNKNFKKVDNIRFRAVHTLEDSADFQRKYSEKFCRGK